ncbi:MAG: hypothetical protein SGPRY_006082 [Prymnesium sp.]
MEGRLALCPPLWSALLGVCGVGGVFVGSLYVCASAADRDSPPVIKRRFLRVGVSSLLAPLLTLLALLPASSPSCLHLSPPLLFGLWGPAPIVSTLLPLALTLTLFAGPLLALVLSSSPFEPREPLLSGGERRRLVLARNLLVGPLAEEWVFRSCACPLLFGAGVGEGWAVLLAAVLFGAAHIHHRLEGTSWAAVGFQFGYTSLFGAYSAYLFLRTGLLYGPVLAHSFCNFMQVPDFASIPYHPRPKLLGATYVVGLGAFIALVTVRRSSPSRDPAAHMPAPLQLDAIYRPALFGSVYWDEMS